MTYLEKYYSHLLPAFPSKKMTEEEVINWLTTVIDGYIEEALFYNTAIKEILHEYGKLKPRMTSNDKIVALKELINTALA